MMSDRREEAEALDPNSPAIAWLPGTAKAASPGPLAGMDFLVKDVFDVAGWPTTASSTFLGDLRPPPAEDAAMVSSLGCLGAVCRGKTHLNEFAYGLSGENPHFGDCPHPEDGERLSGGSSSGSAYAVAKGWVPLALGTDTGGSIRVPAAFCGVWGIRYSPGFLMRGCFPLAPSLDTAGFFTRSPGELRRVHEALTGAGPKAASGKPLEVRKLGAISSSWCLSDEVTRGYRKAFAERGMEVDESLAGELSQWMETLPEAFSVLQSLEALEVHGDWLDRYREAYDPAVFGRIERARHWRMSDIEQARRIRRDFDAWFTTAVGPGTVLALPAVPCPSPRKGDLTEPFRERLLALTTPFSLAGWPALLEPVLWQGGPLTTGIQYAGADLPTLSAFLAGISP
ncbi:MAG: amidase family protein [Oceanipulchritudo sp.]